MLYGILRLASCLSRTVLSHHSERILQLYTEDLDGEKGTSSVLHSRNTFFFFMSTSIFCVETTCNVLELGHYVIKFVDRLKSRDYLSIGRPIGTHHMY